MESTGCEIDITNGRYGNILTVDNSTYFRFVEPAGGGNELYLTEMHGNATVESQGAPKSGYKTIIHSPSVSQCMCDLSVLNCGAPCLGKMQNVCPCGSIGKALGTSCAHTPACSVRFMPM